MSRVNEKLLEDLSAKDDLLFRLGDTLDVKASIVMVVITFVGTETAYFFSKSLHGIPFYLQVLSVAGLVFATLASIAGLWPRRYWMPDPEGIVAHRIKELKDFYTPEGGDIESNILGQLELDEIGWARKRIADNRGKNSVKSRCLDYAFYSTAIAIFCNVATLVWFTHPF